MSCAITWTVAPKRQFVKPSVSFLAGGFDLVMPQQQVVWVKWVDSASENGWVGRADALSQRVVEIYQIGFLIAEDERQITLSATTYVDGGDATCPYHSPVAIPKIAILERGEVTLS